MQITLELPDQLARSLREKHPDLSRHLLESLALEGFRRGDLSHAAIKELLGFDNRYEVDAFLKQAQVPTYTEGDLARDREAFQQLHAR